VDLGQIFADIIGLEDDLRDTITLVKIVPFSFVNNQSTAPMIDVIGQVGTALSSVAYTLLLFFFFYDFLKKTIMLEFVNWENVVKLLLRFFVAKFILTNCSIILEGIAYVADGMLTGIETEAGQVGAMQRTVDGTQVLIDFALMGIVDKIFFFEKYKLIWWGMMLIRLAILLIVYGRYIEICIYTAIAPIPLATLASEEASHIAKKFLQGYAAVLLQGVLIIIMCYIYVGVSANFLQLSNWANNAGDLLQYILCALVLLFTLLKSGNWAKQIMGV